MEELIRALKGIEIEQHLKEVEKEATSYFTRGLFECGNKLNQDILIIKKYLKG